MYCARRRACTRTYFSRSSRKAFGRTLGNGGGMVDGIPAVLKPSVKTAENAQYCKKRGQESVKASKFLVFYFSYRTHRTGVEYREYENK